MIRERSSIPEDVNGDLPWLLVNQFSTLPRWKPEDVNYAADVIGKHLTDEQIPFTMHEPFIYLSIPYEASVTAGGKSFHAKPPAYSRSVPDGLQLPLVYLPADFSQAGTDFFATNLSQEVLSKNSAVGKIVITEGFGIPGKIRELEAAGALGVITINPGEDIHWAICTQVWGTPGLSDRSLAPKIPVVSVNRSSGDELIELAKSGSSVTIRTRLDEGWFSQKVPVVEIPGTESTEEFVLLHGHYDSWDVGVGDNATGDAALLEMARVLWKNRGSLRRSVRIAWWPGHSTGRYAGSTWFADAFAIDLSTNCVAQINCDSPGCRWATTFNHLSLMPESESFVRSVVQEVAGISIEATRAPRAGDWSFNNIGITGLLMLSSTMPDDLRATKGYYAVGGCGGNIAWHTENDTLEIADREILIRDIKVYLAAVLGIANAEVLPFDWRATVAIMHRSLDQYQAKLGTLYSLNPALSATVQLEQSIAAFYEDIEKGKIPAKTANKVIKELARILVPLDHTTRARFVHDRALPSPSLPLLSLADTITTLAPADQAFAVVDLRRAQNRVTASLLSAVAMIESVIHPQ